LACWNPHEFLTRHSGTQDEARETEPISATMVPAFAAIALGGNDDLKGSA
jgi:hypothetical protein